jgi:DNA-directed RNA polymerase specialized sigma24 family protein
VVILAQIDFYLADQSGVMKMTTILPPPLGSQLSPGNQMNDTPAESGSRQRDLELLRLVQEIQAIKLRKAVLETQGCHEEALQRNKLLRKQIDLFLRKVIDCLKSVERALIRKWSGVSDIESIVAEAVSKTAMEVIKDIDNYNPNKPNTTVMKWICKILHSRFKDLLRKYRERYESISFDNEESKVQAKIQEEINDDSAVIYQSAREEMLNTLKWLVETDPELYPLKWQEIADQFDIPRHTTVSSFHDRQLDNLRGYFRRYLF